MLGRGAAFHTLFRWAEAAQDYGAAIGKNPADVQPFWLRYALESFELGRRAEALGIGRRITNKFGARAAQSCVVGHTRVWPNVVGAYARVAKRSCFCLLLFYGTSQSQLNPHFLSPVLFLSPPLLSDLDPGSALFTPLVLSTPLSKDVTTD